MTDSRRLLRHFVAALAYRTQKALRGAPAAFSEFRAGTHVRTPHELVWHMTGVIGYARTMFHGGTFAPPPVAAFDEEVARFHQTLAGLRDDLTNPASTAAISDEQLLQGPLSDAMTHAGQLALLRRLAGAPVASENFIHARVSADNVTANQPEPAAPDAWWRPDSAAAAAWTREGTRSPMKIALASDHAGVRFKALVATQLKAAGHEVVDFGTSSLAPVDYPDFIRLAAAAVASGECERGVVFGGSGNGEAMAANRYRGVRCALCWNEETARLARAHNDANVLSIGARLMDEVMLAAIVAVWLRTPFEGGRHLRRIEKLDQLP